MFAETLLTAIAGAMAALSFFGCVYCCVRGRQENVPHFMAIAFGIAFALACFSLTIQCGYLEYAEYDAGITPVYAAREGIDI